MIQHKIKVRIIDAKGSFISFRYINSNAQSRVKKTAFMEDVEKGVFEVTNPEILGDS